jgi:hypothetical protein
MNRRSAATLLLSTAVLIGAQIGVATRAEASPLTDNYTIAAWPIICSELDWNPTVHGVYQTGLAIAADGLTYEEAGQVLYQSVAGYCPRHLDLLRRFVDLYADNSVGQVHA